MAVVLRRARHGSRWRELALIPTDAESRTDTDTENDRV
jgi:hypothetical protein